MKGRRGNARDIIFLPALLVIMLLMAIIGLGVINIVTHSITQSINATENAPRSAGFNSILNNINLAADTLLNIPFFIYVALIILAIGLSLTVKYHPLSMPLSLLAFGIAAAENYYLSVVFTRSVLSLKGSIPISGPTIWLAANFKEATLLAMAFILVSMYVSLRKPSKGFI